jgi:hypothetical protein
MAQKGFFGSLFDLSFSEFVTTRVIKGLFVILIVLPAIGALAALIGGVARGGPREFLAIIIAPIAFFLYVLVVRIWLEVIIVLFRIAENTARLVEQGDKKAGA